MAVCTLPIITSKCSRGVGVVEGSLWAPTQPGRPKQLPGQCKAAPTKTQGDKKNPVTANQKTVSLTLLPCVCAGLPSLLVCEHNVVYTLSCFIQPITIHSASFLSRHFNSICNAEGFSMLSRNKICL